MCHLAMGDGSAQISCHMNRPIVMMIIRQAPNKHLSTWSCWPSITTSKSTEFSNLYQQCILIKFSGLEGFHSSISASMRNDTSCAKAHSARAGRLFYKQLRDEIYMTAIHSFLCWLQIISIVSKHGRQQLFHFLFFLILLIRGYNIHFTSDCIYSLLEVFLKSFCGMNLLMLFHQIFAKYTEG